MQPAPTTSRIAVLPGDGIGPEVADVALAALTAVARQLPSVEFEFIELPIGARALAELGDPLPDETIERAKSADAVLHAATDAAAIPRGQKPPVSGLRRALECFGSLRPSVTRPGVTSLHDGVDLVVVRELTEGTYSKIEYEVAGAVHSLRITSRAATSRIARLAFQQATRRRGHVTVVHKLAGVPRGDGLWLEVVNEVRRDFPDVVLDTGNVDAVAHDLVVAPHRFDVILAENQNGDVLSDVAAAVTGGLPLAASACIGDRWAYFEPVHGSAPTIAGHGIANPAGMLLASVMMLRHLGLQDGADALDGAVGAALGSKHAVTADRGGTASTSDFLAVVLAALGAD
jgi:isocitrate/isopropylmalate dehydrogenase